MRDRRTLRLLCCGLALAWMPSPAAAEAQDPSLPENLLLKARISASSEYSKDYQARFVADGRIPEAGGRDDPGKAWCVKGETHRNGAELTFEWDAPQRIAEIIYYGRTAWFLNECWKGCEIYTDGSDAPVLETELEMGHGPQRLKLPVPVTARKVRLRFTSSYGGPNPGASEIQVFSTSPSAEALRRVSERARRMNDEYYAGDLEIANRPGSRRLREALLAGEMGFRSMLVIQRRSLDPTHVYTYHNEGFQPGGGLYLFTPDEGEGTLRELVASPEGQVLDCDLSHDGKEILFSWRRNAGDTYHVYRMAIDGTDLARITDGPWYDFNACWLPDGGIVFLSTRRPAFAYCWTSPVGILHRMDRGGTGVRQISANYLNDFTPSVTGDGRIIFGRWEYVDRPAIPIQSLWTIHPDGSGLAAYYGNRVLSPATFIEPRIIPGTTTVLCTMTAHNGPCRGAIGIIDPTYGDNAQASIRNLTPEVDIGRVDQGSGNHVRGPYESPFPLDGEHFLASRKGTIILRDYDGTRQIVLLRPRGGLGYYSAQPVRPRPRPPVVRSTLPRESGPWATVFIQDVYRGLEPEVKRGEIKQICVVQEIEKSRMADTQYRAFGFQFPVVSCGATYAPKKVWGYAAVAEDGSACFKVPAELPIYFMAIDARGRALQRMRSFTQLMPGEVRSCIGCHEPRNEAPRHRKPAAAMSRPPQELEPPEWGLGGFSYPRIVQPVLDEHCVKCHNHPRPAGGVDLSRDMTDFFNVSYETLAREGAPGKNPYTSWIPTYNGHEANILVIRPSSWGSPASRLADLVLTGHPDGEGKARLHMDEASRRRILAWIDLNVPYYGTSLSNHYDRTGCRRMYPPDLDSVLERVAKTRCVSCHGTDGKGPARIPRKEWLRVGNPQRNNFLVAPLARATGGTEACGRAIFASTDDPDYQAILATFAPIREMLRDRPRMDLAGLTSR